MERLYQERRVEPFTPCFLPAKRDHVGGHIATIYVEAVTKPRQQQPAGAASGIQRRLPLLDEAAEVLDLRALCGELGPPFGNEAVSAMSVGVIMAVTA